MELVLKRVAFKESYTIGRLYVDNYYFCDTLEDRNRDTNKNGSFDCGEYKVYSQTCIPFGRYKIELRYSPKFSPRYKRDLPLLLNVPSFSGVLIHPGNTCDDTAGCILVGKNKVVGKVVESRSTWDSLMDDYLQPAWDRSEPIFILIK